MVKSFADYFDKILCINLDGDLDRWVDFMEQARKYGFADKVVRIPGVFSKVSGYGCARAHTNAMDYARRYSCKNVLVLEDDVKFLCSPQEMQDLLAPSEEFIKTGDWDIIYLGMSLRDRLFKETPGPGTLIPFSRKNHYGRFAMAVNARSFNMYRPIPPAQFFSREHRGDVYLKSRNDLKKFALYPLPASVTNAPSKNDPIQNSGNFVENFYKKYGMMPRAENKIVQPEFGPECAQDASIIIPAWRTADYIEECLDAVYAQQPREILVGVDGCTKTLNKLLEIRHKYDNLRIFFSKNNVGCYVIRNSLVRKSRGSKLIFFDSDDIMRDDLIPTVCANLDKYDVVRFRFLQFWYNDRENTTRSNFHGYGQFGIRRSVFEKAGGYLSWVCGADGEFHKRISAFTKALRMNEPMFYRRKHDSALTVKEDTKPKSKIRENYKAMIKETYTDMHIDPEYIEMEEHSAADRSMKVSFNMATYPGGAKYLEDAMKSILPICDIFRIYLNGYESVPPFIKNNPKIEYVLGDRDMGSNGRLFWAGTYKNEYYFTCDDDIAYSAEYVRKHIAALKKYGGKVLVTSHGKVLSGDKTLPIFDKARILKKAIFYLNHRKDMWCNLGGVGVMCFDNSKIKVDAAEFTYTTMCDLYMARFAERNNIPILVREHRGSELKNLLATEKDREGRIWTTRKSRQHLHREVERDMVWNVRLPGNEKMSFI